MKTINVRELRSGMPHLREMLAQSHELLLVSNGEPVARILPVVPIAPRASLASLRSGMAQLDTTAADLLREERDRG
jgi:antitoxin (DNA-binding transcriptional repressor) of toxin-antitoxin stability system